MITGIQTAAPPSATSTTAAEETPERQTYRNLRQAWRYYYRTHKVDLAILYQLTGLRDRLDPDKDPEQYAHAVKAVEAINGVLAQNRIIQTRISALMTDCRKSMRKTERPIMSSNLEMPPQELYVDWPEQPWPRLSGQLDRKQLRRELLDALKHLSDKAKLRIGPSGTTSKKVHYACESRYIRLIASDCVALAVVTRKRLEADKPAGYCGHIAPKSGRIYPDKPNYFTQFWKRSMPGSPECTIAINYDTCIASLERFAFFANMADSDQNCCAENCYFGVTNHRGNFIAVHPYYIGNFLRLVEILHRHLGGRLKMTLRVPAAQSGPLRFSFLAGKNAGDCYILDYAVMPFWHKHPLKGFRRVVLNRFQIGSWAGKNKP